eukprot:6179082-Pleurochrysis_carterae.AAC.3
MRGVSRSALEDRFMPGATLMLSSVRAEMPSRFEMSARPTCAALQAPSAASSSERKRSHSTLAARLPDSSCARVERDARATSIAWLHAEQVGK